MVQFERKVKSATLETICGTEVLKMTFRDGSSNTTDPHLINMFKQHVLIGSRVILHQSAETTEWDCNCMARSGNMSNVRKH